MISADRARPRDSALTRSSSGSTWDSRRESVKEEDEEGDRLDREEAERLAALRPKVVEEKPVEVQKPESVVEEEVISVAPSEPSVHTVIPNTVLLLEAAKKGDAEAIKELLEDDTEWAASDGPVRQLGRR